MTTSIDSRPKAAKSSSRRALLAGALGGIGAVAVGAVGRVSPVRGANGDIIHVGDDLTGSATTKLTNSANNNPVLQAESATSTGVEGISTSGYGVYGRSKGSTTGVRGFSQGGTGVDGETDGFNMVGVHGHSISGIGVRGESIDTFGVHGTSRDGVGVMGQSEAPDHAGIVGQSEGNSTGLLGASGAVPGAKAKTGAYGEANQSSGKGVWGHSNNGQGVRGDSNSGYGVFGRSNNVAVWGYSPSAYGAVCESGSHIGMLGYSEAGNQPAAVGWSNGDSTGLLGTSGATPPAKPRTGVYGYANQRASSRGVWGHSPKGHGIHGQATKGVGVFGTSTSGFAFRGSGRVRFDKVSGVKSIPAGSSGVTVSPGVDVTSDSFVLLTPKANIGSRGLWYTTNASGDSFRIHMSSTRSSATKVAWLLLG